MKRKQKPKMDFAKIASDAKTSLRLAMRDRLTEFLKQNFEMPTAAIEETVNGVIGSYEEPSRHYHNLVHVFHCLAELDALTSSAPDAELDHASIELAIWYHDVVYDPRSRNNEDDSRRRMRLELGDFNTDIDLGKVGNMILATTHVVVPDSPSRELQYFLDIDLAILGQNESAYGKYARKIRREFSHVWAPLFYFARKKILRELARKQIFWTDLFREKYEDRAQKNVRSELLRWPYRMLPF